MLRSSTENQGKRKKAKGKRKKAEGKRQANAIQRLLLSPFAFPLSP